MGKKYALIVIKDNAHTLSDERIRASFALPSGSIEEIVKKDIERWKYKYKEEPSDVIIDLYRSSAQNAFEDRLSIRWCDDLWLIKDQELTFETIQDAAIKLSSSISLPIVYCSNFDDDIWIMGICQQGQELTSHTISACLDDFEIAPSIIDISIATRTLGLLDSDMIRPIADARSIREAEHAFSSLFHLKR